MSSDLIQPAPLLRVKRKILSTEHIRQSCHKLTKDFKCICFARSRLKYNFSERTNLVKSEMNTINSLYKKTYKLFDKHMPCVDGGKRV